MRISSLKETYFIIIAGIFILLITSNYNMTNADYNAINSPTEGINPNIVTAIWQKLDTIGRPPGHIHHHTTFDSDSNRTILYGGNDHGVVSSETWAFEYENRTWTNRNTTTTPLPMSYYGLSYDSANKKTIAFGGIADTIPTNETWAYDYETNTWENRTPTFSPTWRRLHNLVYDIKNDKTILFGGNANPRGAGGFAVTSEIWAYDYPSNTWTELTPEHSPIPRQYHVMTYDSLNEVVILHGGSKQTINAFDQLDDTWVYHVNNNTWIEMCPANPPPLRIMSDMVFDIQIGRAVMHSGTNGPDTFAYGDTWLYDYLSNTWTELETTGDVPIINPNKGISYDIANDKVILYGGRTVTEPYENSTWALSISGMSVNTQTPAGSACVTPVTSSEVSTSSQISSTTTTTDTTQIRTSTTQLISEESNDDSSPIELEFVPLGILVYSVLKKKKFSH